MVFLFSDPTGYYFGKQGSNGIILYEFPYDNQVSSETDMIAFGFMTEREDGVLYRLESSVENKDYIEIRLVGSVYTLSENNDIQ